MVLRARISPVAITLFILSFPALARAEPISFLFRVQVVGDYAPQPFEPFDLVATFDSRVTFLSVARDFREEHYGEVTFSAIPLVAPPPYPDLPFATELPSVSEQALLPEPEGRFAQFGLLSRTIGQKSPHLNGCCAWAATVTLEGVINGLAQRPDLNPRELGRVVEGSGNQEFTFFYTVSKLDLNTGEFKESLSYGGFTTFVRELTAPEPVPEPNSLILIGAGLAAIWRRPK